MRHGGVRYRCIVCIKAYASKDAMENHMEQEHNIQKVRLKAEYPCGQCDKMYVQRRKLQEHINAEHTDKRYSCEFCNEVFKYSYGLVRHKNSKHNNYDRILKEGKDTWTYIMENKVPMDVLPERIAQAVRKYLWYVAANKVVYGEKYLRV